MFHGDWYVTEEIHKDEKHCIHKQRRLKVFVYILSSMFIQKIQEKTFLI